MDNLFQLKSDLATVGAELQNVSAELMKAAANPAVPIEDVTTLENKQANLQKRFDLIQGQHDKLEAAQKARIQQQRQQDTIANAKTEEARLIAARAEFIRAKVEGREMSLEAKEVLAQVTPLRALPTISESGANLLPTNMDRELIHEPFVKNPLRGRIGMTAIKGLELPKIDFTLDSDAFITDAETAKEIQLTGDKVTFNRNKFKVKVRIADTVLHGSDVDLVSYVENALRSGLAAKEKKEAFAEGDGLSLNSFYEDDGESTAAYLITAVTGEDLYSAITNALADLHEDFRENAAVCMRFSDWVTILKSLSNSAMPLYGKQPEEIIGAPVFFCDAAAISDGAGGKTGVPIIGDFRYFHVNYDPDTIYDSDKNVDSGDYIWVLTAWFDMKFKLRSAFRLAVVEEEGEL